MAYMRIRGVDLDVARAARAERAERAGGSFSADQLADLLLKLHLTPAQLKDLHIGSVRATLK
jgi:hypothetical protein